VLNPSLLSLDSKTVNTELLTFSHQGIQAVVYSCVFKLWRYGV